MFILIPHSRIMHWKNTIEVCVPVVFTDINQLSANTCKLAPKYRPIFQTFRCFHVSPNVSKDRKIILNMSPFSKRLQFSVYVSRCPQISPTCPKISSNSSNVSKYVQMSPYVSKSLQLFRAFSDFSKSPQKSPNVSRCLQIGCLRLAGWLAV